MYEQKIQDQVAMEVEKRLAEGVLERVAMEIQAYLASLSTLKIPSDKVQQMCILQKEAKYRLVVSEQENGNLVVVAEGITYPWSLQVMHNSSSHPNHYTVSIQIITSSSTNGWRKTSMSFPGEVGQGISVDNIKDSDFIINHGGKL